MRNCTKPTGGFGGPRCDCVNLNNAGQTARVTKTAAGNQAGLTFDAGRLRFALRRRRRALHGKQIRGLVHKARRRDHREVSVEVAMRPLGTDRSRRAAPSRPGRFRGARLVLWRRVRHVHWDCGRQHRGLGRRDLQRPRNLHVDNRPRRTSDGGRLGPHLAGRWLGRVLHVRRRHPSGSGGHRRLGHPQCDGALCRNGDDDRRGQHRPLCDRLGLDRGGNGRLVDRRRELHYLYPEPRGLQYPHLRYSRRSDHSNGRLGD